ncbi:MAG: hypothetical protein IPO26_02120 [Saprospiraceae bacterium]|nr:hypothetical protein [Saprospiraceae bacterium]MBK9583854.1 hypothetical protein [Saprospiraceae bacterium]
MGLDTKIYLNHSLNFPENTDEVIKILTNIWDGKTEVVKSLEIKENELISNSIEYKILICPKLIEFEYPKFKQIRLRTNFKFSGDIILYAKTICITPVGIGRNATNMITEFMDEPFSIYLDEPVRFSEQKKTWNLFKSFLKSFTEPIEGNIHLYINDGQFQGVEDLAYEGANVEEMIEKAKGIVKPCTSKAQFIEEHTSLLNERTYINGDIWFYKDINLEQ